MNVSVLMLVMTRNVAVVIMTDDDENNTTSRHTRAFVFYSQVMDAALLLVAGNETCPQPQTSEHLAAVEIMRLQNIIILQNKVRGERSGVGEG